MASARPELASANDDRIPVSRIQIKNAGGIHRRFVIVVEYAPRKGHKVLIRSNHRKYGKSWATREEITEEDQVQFVSWINNHLATDGVGGHRPRTHSHAVVLASRSSKRRDADVATVRLGAAEVVVEQSVLQCVRFLVHSVVYRSRLGIDGLRINYVPSKRHSKTMLASTSTASRSHPFSGLITKRMRAVKYLTQRKRTSKGYQYRQEVLKRRAALKAEEDLQWLECQCTRLATLVARQQQLELLPEGVLCRSQPDHSYLPRFPCCKLTSVCPLIGDYSDAQLLRVHRQALVLHRFYGMLTDAIVAHRDEGIVYIVAALAYEAGQVLGEEAVAVSTVKYWHLDYVDKGGKFTPDERGHHSRELLVNEEDVKRKFVKWSLLKAKSDELDVESARDFLNNELLNTLQAC